MEAVIRRSIKAIPRSNYKQTMNLWEFVSYLILIPKGLLSSRALGFGESRQLLQTSNMSIQKNYSILHPILHILLL